MSASTAAALFSDAEKHATATDDSAHSPPPPPQQQQTPAKQRSCVTCRQRKVRCDKLSPCTNCRRADIPCILPAAERPPRWARRLKQQQQGQQLVQQGQQGQQGQQKQQKQQGQSDQQGRPEPHAQGHAAQTAAPLQTTAPNVPQPSNPTDVSAVLERLQQLEALVRDLRADHANTGGVHISQSQVQQVPAQPTAATAATAATTATEHPPEAARMGEVFGRLILDDDASKRSRYVSSGFWSTIDDELDAVRRETTTSHAATAASDADDFSSDDSDDVLSDDEDVLEGDLSRSRPPGDSSTGGTVTTGHTSNGNTGRTTLPEAAHRSIAERNAFLFGHNLQPSLGDSSDYRPLPSQISFLFQVFVVNVNILCQVVHVPTVNNIISGLVGGPTRSPASELAPATEALLFSIYYAAIMSMEEDDVVKTFGLSSAELSLRYRIGLEMSLVKADFLNTSDLEVVQALVIFLMLCRRYDSPRFVWMMTGLVIRMAMALGLHRDGSNFGDSLSPYDVELRRRVWCTVCALDVRSSEDQGTDLSITPDSYDTRFPLCINDNDISPETKVMPAERNEVTDMTHALLNFEITRLAQRMMASTKLASLSAGIFGGTAPGATSSSSSSEHFLQEQNRMLEEVHQKLESVYLRHSPDTTSVIYWTSVVTTRLFIAKMTLILNLPRLLQQPDKSSSAPAVSLEDLRTRLLTSAIEVAEYNEALKTERACRRWRWLCETYTQWHAIAFLLIETGRRPWGPAVERAWAALHSPHLIPAPAKKKAKDAQESSRQSDQAATSSSSTGAGSASNSLTSSASENSQFFWLPLRRLMARARRHRASELARLRADTKAARDLEIEYELAVASGRSRPLSNPGAVDAFRERWRRLVGLDEAARGAAGTSDASWNTSIRPFSNGMCHMRAERPLGTAYLRSFTNFTEQEYTSPAFPSGQAAQSGQARSTTTTTPAPNSLDEFIRSGVGLTPNTAPPVTGVSKGYDPWQIWGTKERSEQSRHVATSNQQVAPNLPYSNLPFVGVAGVDPGNIDFNVDFSAESLTMPLFFDEDLDIDMDAEPIIDWDNWFESAKGI